MRTSTPRGTSPTTSRAACCRRSPATNAGEGEVASCQLPVSSFRFPVSGNCQLPTSNFQLPTANCQLPTPNCQLPTANCQLPTADWATGQLGNGQLATGNR